MSRFAKIMASDLRQRLHKIAGSPAQDESKRQFQELTGINFETDIERIVACFDATQVSAGNSGSGVVLARRPVRPGEDRGADA